MSVVAPPLALVYNMAVGLRYGGLKGLAIGLVSSAVGGYLGGKIPLGGLSGFTGGVARGAINGAISGGIAAGLSGQNIGQGMLAGAAAGGLAGGISYRFGQAIKGTSLERFGNTLSNTAPMRAIGMIGGMINGGVESIMNGIGRGVAGAWDRLIANSGGGDWEAQNAAKYAAAGMPMDYGHAKGDPIFVGYEDGAVSSSPSRGGIDYNNISAASYGAAHDLSHSSGSDPWGAIVNAGRDTFGNAVFQQPLMTLAKAGAAEVALIGTVYAGGTTAAAFNALPPQAKAFIIVGAIRLSVGAGGEHTATNLAARRVLAHTIAAETAAAAARQAARGVGSP